MVWKYTLHADIRQFCHGKTLSDEGRKKKINDLLNSHLGILILPLILGNLAHFHSMEGYSEWY